MRVLAPYLAFSRIAFLQILAYRLRYFTGIVTYLINVTVYYFIWKALYHDGGEIQGFHFKEMITYVAIGWIIRTFYFNNIDREMANDVVQGHVAARLIRPVSYQWTNIAQAAGESCFRMVMFTVPTGLVILSIYPVQAPASIMSFCSFLVALVLSFSIFAGLNFIVGTFAVYLHSILGLIRAKYFLVEILSGLVIPVSFFPDPLIRLSDWLPFQYISYTPLMIYMGKLVGSALGRTLLFELAWVVTLFFLGHWLWRHATRKITVQGG